MAVVPPGVVVLGDKLSVIKAAIPGTNAILTDPEDPPELAVTIALPLVVGEVKVICAIPLAFVVAVVSDSVPPLLLKVTVAPEMTTPPGVLTVAKIVVALKPSAVMLAALDVTVTLPTIGGVTPPTPKAADATNPSPCAVPSGAKVTVAVME